MAMAQWETQKLITVFGGSGFIGRQVVNRLAQEGWRIRVACRRPDLAFVLQPLGVPGQIFPVQANLRDPHSLAAALKGASAAINLVGILAETGKQRFDAIHGKGPGAVAEAVKAAGINNFVHVSAIGADAASASAYARSKAAGEAAVRAVLPDAVILRPSVVFGPGDDFFNRFGAMGRFFPFETVVGGNTKFQPVYVGDVAEAVVRAVSGKARKGATYELGGPEVRSFESLVRYVLAVSDRERPVLNLSFGMGKFVASIMQTLEALSLGLFPKLLRMTTDQVELLKHDNVVSDAAKAEGRTLEGLGIAPTAFESVAPSYLYRFRPTGQYEEQRS